MTPKYTLGVGRTIFIDGKAAVYLGIVTDNAKGGILRIAPAEADALAHRVVEALNFLEEKTT